MTRPFSKRALVEDLRRIGRERGLGRKQLAHLIGRSTYNVPSPTPAGDRQVGWDTLVLWLDKLGWEIRYELVPKEKPERPGGSLHPDAGV